MEHKTRIERNKQKKVEQKQTRKNKGLVTLRAVADVTRIVGFIEKGITWISENLS